MAQKSEIEWTDATWNPVTGCTKIGPGCDNCYAERFAERWRGIPDHPYEQGFDLRLWPSRLSQPALWKKPRMIFVNSMSDLFHKQVPREYIDRVFEVMEAADWHVYQVLTKRSSLMRSYVQRRYQGGEVPSHIWLGVSVEDAAHVSRIRHLQGVNSPARFISFEPLLGPVGEVDLTGIAVGHRRRGERTTGKAHGSRMGTFHTHNLRAIRYSLFLQAVGRTTPEEWWPSSRRRGVERFPSARCS